MHTEYEVRVLEIDVDKIKSKLEELNIKQDWDLLQRRYVYDFIPRIESKWIRLRTNGKKTTLTIKDVTSSKIDGTKELEIEVDDFDNTSLILKELGYNYRCYQENRRIQYHYKDVEIDIDYWPLIPTYLEIEGPDEKSVYEVLELLGYNKDEATTRDVEGVYQDYGYEILEIKELKLEEERK